MPSQVLTAKEADQDQNRSARGNACSDTIEDERSAELSLLTGSGQGQSTRSEMFAFSCGPLLASPPAPCIKVDVETQPDGLPNTHRCANTHVHTASFSSDDSLSFALPIKVSIHLLVAHREARCMGRTVAQLGECDVEQPTISTALLCTQPERIRVANFLPISHPDSSSWLGLVRSLSLFTRVASTMSKRGNSRNCWADPLS